MRVSLFCDYSDEFHKFERSYVEVEVGGFRIVFGGGCGAGFE